MNARIATPHTSTKRNERDIERPALALIAGSAGENVVEFGRCYGRSSGYASARRYAPRNGPALFRFR